MTALENSNSERVERFGRNVVLVVDLIRHPEKDYVTGDLTEDGKRAFVEKLEEEYADPDNQFDTIKAYVSPMRRGQQAMEPLATFLEENGIATTIRTKHKLAALSHLYTDTTNQAVNKILQERGLLELEQKDSTRDITLGPGTKNEETLKSELIIREFFHANLPESSFRGLDIANEIDSLVQYFAKMGRKLRSDSRVKIIAVGHSGVIEHLTKLIFLKTHPDLKPEDVGVEQIKGLLAYMDGPRITINSDATGVQRARLEFKGLNLDYKIR